MRLWAQRVGPLDSSVFEDEDVAERRVRAGALAIAFARDTVDSSVWPDAVVAALRDDGAVIGEWINGFKDTSSEEQAAFIAEQGLVAE
jgi:hypothetical protein